MSPARPERQLASADAIAVIMIGCGNFARRYHLPALEADPGIKLAGIFDPVAGEVVRALAERTGAPIVTALEALPRPSMRTMAVVTTPHALHRDHVAFALKCGWHVLCDKPFVLEASDARALAAEAGRLKLVNAVAFNRRFDRGYLRARELVRSGAIGAVRYVETVQLGYEGKGWFLDPALGGGGPYTGRATHMADIVPWLLDRVPTRVRSRIRGGSAARVDRGGFIEVLLGDLECHMTCIEEGWHMWDEVRMFGDDGLIELRRPFKYPIGWELMVRSGRGEALEGRTADPTPGAATADFLAALRTDQPVACSFADAVLATALIEQAFASARSGSAWRELS
jgi:predicted dehydrogenase